MSGKELWQVSFWLNSATPQQDAVLGCLLEQAGIPQEELTELREAGRVVFSVYSRSKQKALKLKKKITSLRLPSLRTGIKYLKPEDWQEKWKKGIKVFPLGNKFEVVPVWTRPRPRGVERRTPIFLDTVLAFGTGLHETTRMMVSLIERRDGRFATFLDVGTGTGILSMVARHCGAAKIDAIDLEPLSVHTAKENLKRNAMKAIKVVRADFGRWNPKTCYDFVAANLATAILLQLGGKLVDCMQPDGYLAVSGVSRPHLRQVQKYFAPHPLKTIKVIRGKEWAALLFRKMGDHEKRTQ